MNLDTSAAIDSLGSALNGSLVRPDDGRYEELRAVWNAMIDRRPAAIARPANVEDVVAVVNTAHEHDLLLAVRNGGHSMPGFSTCDDGLVLDLRDLNAVTVDPAAQTASVQGGALISDLDRATQEHGLAVPMGTVAHTGVAGLTLGGGLGRLTRMHGLSIDALVGVQVVTADGTVVEASDAENPDLLWAMRGAGPNFGVATRLDFRAFPIGKDMGAGLAVYELEHARDALSALGEYERVAAEHLVIVASLKTIPAGPPFPPALHGRRALFVGANSFGPPDQAEKEARDVAQFAPAAFSAQVRVPYLAAQQMNDEYFAWGQRNYVKGALLPALTPETADAALAAFESAPGDHAEIDFIMIGGAASRVAESATAYSGREARFFNGIQSTWQDPSQDAAQRGWCRSTCEALSRFHMSANYVNALEETDPVEVAYGPEKYARLVELKRRYDPQNLFRLNNNIRP
ncbi:MAG TPA: FAD-binding oxidoreductase [Actinomycetota bacterium]